MKKLSAFENVSLDGYFTGVGGDLNWAHQISDPEFEAFVQSNASGGDGTLLMGRVTYDMMVQYWPTPLAKQQNPKVADGMNTLRKVVFSRTMSEATWKNTTLVHDDLVETVRRMKQEGDGSMTILGSGSIVAQLADAGLLDELSLVVKPIAIGKGRSLFEGMTRAARFKLLKTRAFPSGIVLLVYGV